MNTEDKPSPNSKKKINLVFILYVTSLEENSKDILSC